ncbi:methyltransferase [Herbaspirillum hiltneri N3]|uniref:Prepilin leader peptidase/N-methyltransferase n=1 Tax=Herbaspirillum hiltneri N3 TaxID=1262470 RepID=A0ABM5UVY0_9BURK|nr:A24 family peptidase [Herbaspirillum hiltneri]AKZ61366.1 methyltransferase [Herbaspirillum hiltneri N3]
MFELLTLADMHGSGNAAAAALAACAGLLIGSFLNVVIHRLPQMMQREAENYLAHEAGRSLPHGERYNLWTPRSACPHCAAPIAPRHNIPLLGYLLLRGRCAACGTAISRRYPAVEIFTALLSALTAWHFGLGLEGVAALALVCFLIALGFIDARTQLLPDSLTLPLLWLGLLVNLDGTFVPLADAVTGAAAGYLVLWSIYWVFRLATGKEGMGYGDFKLLAALGAWLGWQALPLILVLASCTGAVVGIGMVILRKHGKDQTIPFGPYLALGGVLMLLYGKSLFLFGLY